MTAVVMVNGTKDTEKMITIINNDRLNCGQKVLRYNNDLQKDLELYRDSFGSDWFFKNDTDKHIVTLIYNGKFIANRTQNYNGQFILDYSSFKHFKDFGWRFLYHDTYDKTISSIVKYRSNQKSCFNFHRCKNGTEFNEYVSCLKFSPVLENSKKCSFCWYYFPRHKEPSMTEISCVELNVQGPNVPDSLKNKQFNSFWCYGRFTSPKNDIISCPRLDS